MWWFSMLEKEKPKLTRPLAILIALFVVFLWATSWVLIKIGLEQIPALTFAGLRYTMGFILLLPAFLTRNGIDELRNQANTVVLYHGIN
jgi:drug/metabolite transporter (DMT)-like permease